MLPRTLSSENLFTLVLSTCNPNLAGLMFCWFSKILFFKLYIAYNVELSAICYHYVATMLQLHLIYIIKVLYVLHDILASLLLTYVITNECHNVLLIHISMFYAYAIICLLSLFFLLTENSWRIQFYQKCCSSEKRRFCPGSQKHQEN